MKKINKSIFISLFLTLIIFVPGECFIGLLQSGRTLKQGSLPEKDSYWLFNFCFQVFDIEKQTKGNSEDYKDVMIADMDMGVITPINQKTDLLFIIDFPLFGIGLDIKHMVRNSDSLIISLLGGMSYQGYGGAICPEFGLIFEKNIHERKSLYWGSKIYRYCYSGDTDTELDIAGTLSLGLKITANTKFKYDHPDLHKYDEWTSKSFMWPDAMDFFFEISVPVSFYHDIILFGIGVIW